MKDRLLGIKSEEIPRIDVTGMSHNVPCLDVSDDGKFLVTASIDKHVRIFDIEACRRESEERKKAEDTT